MVHYENRDLTKQGQVLHCERLFLSHNKKGFNVAKDGHKPVKYRVDKAKKIWGNTQILPTSKACRKGENYDNNNNNHNRNQKN